VTYYNRQVISLSAELYANIYLTKKVIQAKYFMDKNFDQVITLDTICKEACISKFHLIRSFKKLYGVTPYQHLTFLRIKKAKELLQTNLPIATVCYHVGFDSPTSFSGLFKKIAGKTPKEFRRSKTKKQF
jgi:transcriptional regulator GlxA family with amidase domain